MKITAHTLFQNEARWLWFSVMSVINHIDKILLWDAGSEDGSYELAQKIKLKYPEKVELRKVGKLTPPDFQIIRQQMLDETDTDWILMLDADEIWWEKNIQKLINEIKKADEKTECFVVPTINLVGDIYHYQEAAAGKYHFGDKVGHYNLRAINTNIAGLHSQNPHGTWGWADGNGKMIQDRNTFKVVDPPYLHATFLQRAGKKNLDSKVSKRPGKFKYELGENFPLDFFYPEVLFKNKPGVTPSPWKKMSRNYKFRAFFETPLRKIKRRFLGDRIGY